MEKVKKLYRGIAVNHEIFDSINFDADMVPPNPPKIDEHGRKVVSDGNEYGVYMTDNKVMANNAYGSCCGGHGVPLGWAGRQYFALPQIGVTFEIDTTGIEIRKPWITSELEGVYNNGFGGDEWIADRIPAKNISIIRVLVGADLFNPSRTLDLSCSMDEIKATVRKIIQKRALGMKLCMDYLTKNPNNSFFFDTRFYSEIFGENGVALQSKPNIDIKTPNELITEIMRVEYHKNKEEINIRDLKYLNSLKEKFEHETSFVNFETIMQDLIKKEKEIMNKQIKNNVNTKGTEKKIDYLNILIQKAKAFSPTEMGE